MTDFENLLSMLSKLHKVDFTVHNLLNENCRVIDIPTKTYDESELGVVLMFDEEGELAGISAYYENEN